MKHFAKWTLGLVAFLVVFGAFTAVIWHGSIWLLAQWKETAFPIAILAMLFSFNKIYVPAKRVCLAMRPNRSGSASSSIRGDYVYLVATVLVLFISYFWLIPGYIALGIWLVWDTITDLPLIFGKTTRKAKSKGVTDLGDDIFNVIGCITDYVKSKLNKPRNL